MLKFKYNQAKKRVTQISDLFQYHFYDLFKQEDLFQKLGLDDGELDILRDNIDKRLYIVDANNTPSSRLLFEPLHLSSKKCILAADDRQFALRKMALSFQKEFVNIREVRDYYGNKFRSWL